MAVNTSAGFATESTYGTGVTPDHWFPLESENIADNVTKLETTARRSGAIVDRSDQSIPIYADSTGDIEIPVMSKDFPWWGPHLTGNAVTTGSITDSSYTHTYIVGTAAQSPLKGKSFTTQINRPFHDSGTDQAFTYAGCKVASWTFEIAAEEEAKLTASIDAQNVTTATALTTPSYPSGLELFSWAHTASALTIAGTAVPITKFSLKVDNGLKVDRRYVRGSGLKKEPVAAAYRDIEWEIECDFDALTQYNRYVASTNAAQYAQVILTLSAPTLIGVSTYPTIVLTIPKARFDKADINNSGFDPNMQTLGGKVRYDGSNAAVTMAITTSQATP